MKKTENFNGIVGTAYDNAGAQFLSSMAKIRDSHDNAERRFEEFCIKENIGGWHITDGYWRSDKLVKIKEGHYKGYNTSCGSQEVNLSWLQCHNKGKRNPKEGETLANIGDCVPPIGEHFEVHIYRVLECKTDEQYFTRHYNLLLEESKWCRWTTEGYEFFEPPVRKTLWDKISTFVNYFN